MAAASLHLLHPPLPKNPTFRPATAPSRLRLLGSPSWGGTRPPPGHVLFRSSGSPGAEALQLALSGTAYNVHVAVEDDEPLEVTIRRFRREVSLAGVIPECRRRRFYENKQDEKKRKNREAGRRNRKRRLGPRSDPVSATSEYSPTYDVSEEGDGMDDNKNDGMDDDNWDMPEVDIPF